MASTSTKDNGDAEVGVVFVDEEDGTVTARDLETGLARGGETRAAALARLAEVLALEAGGGDVIDDPDEFLREELGVDSSEATADDVPEFLR